MPTLHKRSPADEPAIDSCPIITGYENANPPSLIAQTRAQTLQNRIATIDSRNRCRPGITRQTNNAQPFIAGGFYFNNQYLFTDGANLWGYNSTTKILTLLFSSLPFTSGLLAPTINVVQGGASSGAQPVFFMNQGAGMYWWDGTNFNTASMPVASPNMSFPIWAANRLISARTGTNDLVVSDIGAIPLNWGPGNNDTSVRVTLDSDGKDSINGIAAFQAGIIIAAKRARIYAVYADDTISVGSWNKQTVDGSKGVAEHNTMALAGNLLLFLSESGNGVYAIALQQGTSIAGISQRVSDRITPDIQRINWSAISTARAIIWYGLYILAVPVDTATQPNMLLVYSIDLDEWQGLWVAKDTPGGAASIWRVLAYNPSAAAGSELLYAFANGDIGLQTRPLPNGQYFDLKTDGVTQIPIASLMTTRGFHWDSTVIPPSQAGQPFNTLFLNQMAPYNMRFRFNQSTAPVNIDLLSDQSTLLNYRQNLPTTTKTQNLPQNLPWTLSVTGDRYQSINVQPIGVCTELQANISGTGDWRIQRIDASAMIDRPQTNQ